ncbi:MAG: phage tail sheath C-terminal domain-containing protein [Pseudoxanthomonas sp.]
MPATPTYPGVYVEELPGAVHTMHGVETATCAFVGRAPRGPFAGSTDGPVTVSSLAEFESVFGAPHPELELGWVVRDFFNNGGGRALIVRLRHMAEDAPDDAGLDAAGDGGPPLHEADYLGDAGTRSGLHTLREVDGFNLLCLPPDTRGGDTANAVMQAALALCVERRAMLLVDPPAAWTDADVILRDDAAALQALGLEGEAMRNAALYFPRLLQHGPDATQSTRVPCGAVAGVIARTDGNRGVWKAPAGLEASLHGVAGLSVLLDDDDNARINQQGVNALRIFPVHGAVVWGARTLRGADSRSDDYRYVPVRRLSLHIEESLVRGLQWAVFEPNDESLWAQLRLGVGTFMNSLFRQGAFAGTTQREAYFVHCDTSTTSLDDIDLGRCNVQVGFAPLKPAEFVVLQVGLQVGQANA